MSLISATIFYDGILKTPYPFGYVEIYDSEGNKTNLYSDKEGTIIQWPVKLDEFGETQAYVKKDLIYTFIFFDKDGEQKESFNNIQALQGKNGVDNGNPPDTSNIKAPQGFPGLQGDSVIGPPASQEEVDKKRGDKGIKPITEFIASENVEYTIPIGISEVFVTATGAGGSAGNWSPYLLLLPTKDFNNLTAKSSQMGIQYVDSGSQTVTQNTLNYPGMTLQMLSLAPGSGMAGESCFRKKIVISDTTKTHKLNVFLGQGGKAPDPALSLNGNAGGATTVYLDDELVLTLNGGSAGVNSFPLNDTEAESLKTDFRKGFYENFGNDSTYILFNIPYNDTSHTGGDWRPQGYDDNYVYLYGYKASYYQKNGQTSKAVPLLISYNVQYYQFKVNLATDFYQYTVLNHNPSWYKGQKNNFGEVYSRYASSEYFNIDGGQSYLGNNYMNGMRNSVKTKLADGTGAGAGGDAFFGFFTNGKQQGWNNSGYRIPSNYVFYNDNQYTNSSTIVYYDQEFTKGVIIDFLNNFMLADAYKKGLTSIPSTTGGDANNPNVWDKLQSVEDLLKSQKTKVIDGPDFFNFRNLSHGQYNNDLRGGDGVDGFCKIEYGVIKSNTTSSS